MRGPARRRAEGTRGEGARAALGRRLHALAEAFRGLPIPRIRRRRHALGPAGEAWAARYLRRAGLRILERNWRLEAGEIDLVARDGDRYVFVEVKTLRRSDPALALARIDRRKRRRIRGAAGIYLTRHARGADTPHRFDLLIVLGDPRRRCGVRDVRWYRGAF